MALHAFSGGSLGAVIYDSTLTASASSFDIQNIPAAFRQLRLLLMGRSDRAAASTDFIVVRFNNDSGANYDYQFLGSSNAAGTFSETYAATSYYFGDLPAASSPASVAGSVELVIPDYLGTTFHKACLSVHGSHHTATEMITGTSYGRWTSATAINRITVFTATAANFLAGTRLTLYGIS